MIKRNIFLAGLFLAIIGSFFYTGKDKKLVNNVISSEPSTSSLRASAEQVSQKRASSSHKDSQDKSFDQLLFQDIDSYLKALDDLSLDTKARYLMFSALVELLKHRPDYIEDIKTHLLNLEDDGDLYLRQIALLVGALASHPQAEAALVDLLEQEQRPRVALQAAIMMNQVASPSEKVSVGLQRAISKSEPDSHLWNAAWLAYGSVSMRQSGALQERSLEFMNKQLSSQESLLPSQVGAIGNSRHPSFIPWIESALVSDDQALRSKALRALRAMPGEHAASLLEKTFISESDLEVKQNAAIVFRYRPVDESFFQFFEDALSENLDHPSLLKEIIRNTIKNVKSQPGHPNLARVTNIIESFSILESRTNL